jgi:hypothetical protein
MTWQWIQTIFCNVIQLWLPRYQTREREIIGETEKNNKMALHIYIYKRVIG